MCHRSAAGTAQDAGTNMDRESRDCKRVLMPRERENEIRRYLRTGQHDDPLYSHWPGKTVVERAESGHTALRQALVAAVRERTTHAVTPESLAGLDVMAFTRARVAPTVRGLFAGCEQDRVLEVLARSVVFLTTTNVDQVLLQAHWHYTAWALANLYLVSCGARLLSPTRLGSLA